MNCRQRIFAIIYLLPAFILFLFPVQGWAKNDFKVLLIRPQLLTGFSGQEEMACIVRDPFNRPLEQLIPQGEIEQEQGLELFADFSLIAIIWNKELPIAIINDTMVGVGDTVKGATVLEIAKKAVVLEREKMNHTLRPKPLLVDLGMAETGP
ncbi:MAG: hypothetical protein KAR13_05160 [Desulfobulbaceae bacterium]|nr:hypothetical protein [Desulfobulbaceae bacterium]MCK5544922.1 hypothetical protein [Desulfobulbaceae bacterium]